MDTVVEKPNYGNWVSIRVICMPLLFCFIFGGLAFIHPLFAVFAVLLLFISLYFVYARYLFSPQGSNIQNQVRELLLSQLDWNGTGQILDIGCGSGSLSIELARKYEKSHVIGIDYWGKQWEYSKRKCERNAEIEKVSKNTSFSKANASELPFEDESMDVVVSNLVFHEVHSVKDKRDLLKEALRVLRKGGTFVFQDLFLWSRVYGPSEDLLETVRSWGIEEMRLINTNEMPFIPTSLKLPFMLGTICILAGKK